MTSYQFSNQSQQDENSSEYVPGYHPSYDRQSQQSLTPSHTRSRSGRHLLRNGTPVALSEIQSDSHPHAAGFGTGAGGDSIDQYNDDDVSELPVEFDDNDESTTEPDTSQHDLFHNIARQTVLAQRRGINGGIPVKVNSQRSLRDSNPSYHNRYNSPQNRFHPNASSQSLSYHQRQTRREEDDETEGSYSTNATERYQWKAVKESTLELRDPHYLINLLEDMVPKIINNQLVTKNQVRSSGKNVDSGDDNNNNSKHGNHDNNQQQQRRDQAEQHIWDKVRRWLWANPSNETDEQLLHESIHMNNDSSQRSGSNTGNRTAGAFVRGISDMTPLHLICKLPYPPEDIINALIVAAPDTVSWTDAHGWLPLHHVCANGCSTEVLMMFLEAFEDGKLQQDQQKRTPLHFYSTRPSHSDNPTTMAANTALLCENVGQGADAITAAQLTDTNGMLPIHYACAYGTHPSVLKALAKAYPKGLTSRERHGRAPMHLAMVNAHREEVQAVLKFLLEYNTESKNTINARDRQGYLPLHLLAAGLKQQMLISNKHHRILDDLEKRNTVAECLSSYLAAEPKPAADFLTAIKDLPDWLQDTAVVSKHVRNILNEKIVQRFPTSILMLDGIILLVIIVCFAICSKNHINLRFDAENTIDTTQSSLTTVMVGATYFTIREVVQFAALLSLGSASKWFKDVANMLDMLVIIMVFYYSIIMLLPSDVSVPVSLTAFRAGVAVTQGILWVKFIIFLKKTLVDFAVFVGGVFYVVQRLAAFIIAVGTILIAFGQMFYFVYVQTPMCNDASTTGSDIYLPNGTKIYTDQFSTCVFPHCTFGRSFLKVYTMMMGNINGVFRYATNLEAQLLFVAYAFLVVILLSNVLIAIVQDSYEVVQNERAAIVFWSNRLDFVAEMDTIMYAIQRRLGGICCVLPYSMGYGKDGYAYNGDDGNNKSDVEYGNDQSSMIQDTSEQAPGPFNSLGDNSETTSRRSSRIPSTMPEGTTPPTTRKTKDDTSDILRVGWRNLMSLFDKNLYDDINIFESWVYNIFRLFAIFVIIPLWLIIGFVSAGILWPPQVRELLFVQRETVVSRAELERQKLHQLKAVQLEMKELKIEIMREMAHDRDEMIRLKADIETIQSEIYADMMQVKELMDSLLSMY